MAGPKVRLPPLHFTSTSSPPPVDFRVCSITAKEVIHTHFSGGFYVQFEGRGVFSARGSFCVTPRVSWLAPKRLSSSLPPPHSHPSNPLPPKPHSHPFSFFQPLSAHTVSGRKRRSRLVLGQGKGGVCVHYKTRATIRCTWYYFLGETPYRRD